MAHELLFCMRCPMLPSFGTSSPIVLISGLTVSDNMPLMIVNTKCYANSGNCGSEMFFKPRLYASEFSTLANLLASS